MKQKLIPTSKLNSIRDSKIKLSLVGVPGLCILEINSMIYAACSLGHTDVQVLPHPIWVTPQLKKALREAGYKFTVFPKRSGESKITVELRWKYK